MVDQRILRQQRDEPPHEVRPMDLSIQRHEARQREMGQSVYPQREEQQQVVLPQGDEVVCVHIDVLMDRCLVLCVHNQK